MFSKESVTMSCCANATAGGGGGAIAVDASFDDVGTGSGSSFWMNADGRCPLLLCCPFDRFM